MIQRFVLTGTAFAGKTTTLTALAHRGFAIIPEAARALIEEAIISGSQILPWIDIDAFLDSLLERQLELEFRIRSQTVFIDRGIPDELAYFKLLDKPVFPEYLKAFQTNRYDKIFLLETLPGYQIDEVRKEPLEMVQRLRILHEKSYQELGYEVIIVPVMPVEDRVNYILSRVENA